jgi:transcriptional regulator with XRE-family HTH domain
MPTRKPVPPVIRTLGARLRARRQELGWDLRSVGRKARRSDSTVCNIELGRRGTLDSLDRIAKALGMRLVIGLEEVQ